jgi:dolichol kinase
MKFLLRPHEINNLPAAFYFLLGVLICIIYFDIKISILCVIILSIVDPCASICGILIPSFKITKDKSLAGSLGGSLMSSLGIWIITKIL